MASNYQPAPSDMVQQVRSIIQGYGDNGPLKGARPGAGPELVGCKIQQPCSSSGISPS